jgi:hypothetical protein
LAQRQQAPRLAFLPLPGVWSQGFFDELTTARNSCHQAANRSFIVIRSPAQFNFCNQDFVPPGRAR